MNCITTVLHFERKTIWIYKSSKLSEVSFLALNLYLGQMVVDNALGFLVDLIRYVICSRILVGAPEDEPYHINDVRRPGAVYRCQPGYRGYLAEDSSKPLQMCSLMEFDKNRSKCFILYD